MLFPVHPHQNYHHQTPEATKTEILKTERETGIVSIHSSAYQFVSFVLILRLFYCKLWLLWYLYILISINPSTNHPSISPSMQEFTCLCLRDRMGGRWIEDNPTQGLLPSNDRHTGTGSCCAVENSMVGSLLHRSSNEMHNLHELEGLWKRLDPLLDKLICWASKGNTISTTRSIIDCWEKLEEIQNALNNGVIGRYGIDFTWSLAF